jgi:hypothetical protein
MEKVMSEHRLGETAILENMTVIPVEKVVYSAGEMGKSLWLTGAVEPIAVIIVTSGGVTALDLNACEISLRDIQKMAPNLSEKIDQRISQISDDDTGKK